MLLVAPARTFGDSIFFLLGRKGHSALGELTGKRLNKFSEWLGKKPGWAIPFVAYLYTSLLPLPQDILMIILGLGKAKFRYVFIAILLGNATFIGLIYIFSSLLI